MVVLVLSLAFGAIAAEVVLTPESALSLPIATPAPYEQSLQGLASNGAEYLAVWIDRRSTIPPLGITFSGSPLYVARLDTLGRPKRPFGAKLLDNVVTAALIGQPSGYILFWSDTDQVNWMRLNDDGEPVTAPARLTDGYVTGAVSNGRTVLITHGPFSGTQSASLFTVGGTQLSRTELGANAPVHPVLLADDRYGVVAELPVCNGSTPCVDDEILTIIPEGGATSSTLLRRLTGFTQSAAVVGGEHLLVAWLTDTTTPPRRTVSFQIFSVNGDPITSEKVIEETGVVGTLNAGFAPSAGWDGHEFLIAYPWPTVDLNGGEIRTVRVTKDGVVLDTPAQVLSIALGSAPRFATSFTGVLLGWNTALNGAPDIAVRPAASFDSTAVAFTNIIPQTAALQSQVQNATIGTNRLTVWREGQTDDSIRASSSVKGTLTIALSSNRDHLSPAVGASNAGYLVAWREQPSASGSGAISILAKRVAMDGNLVDNAPIVVAFDAGAAITAPFGHAVAVGSDGTNFLVAWTASQDRLRLVRVSATGAVLDSTPIELPPSGTPSSPQIVWNGSSYVVAWIADPSCKICLSPLGPPVSQIEVARIGADGTIVAAPKQVWNGGYGSAIGLAKGTDNLMLAWGVAADVVNENICINAMPLTNDGVPELGPQKISCAGRTGSTQYPDVDVAWDGGSFVIAWTEVGSSRAAAKAIRVTSSASPRDNTPFEIANTTESSFEAALAPLPDGVAIAYERIATEETYGSVSRAFERKLLRAKVPIRRRAVER